MVLPFILLSFAQKPAPSLVVLPEDELILPPYLVTFEGGSILNTSSAGHKKRAAAPAEWLEYGDSFSLPARLSFQVYMNEYLEWVGGGVFEGTIGKENWIRAESADQVRLENGWMKVWVKPSPQNHGKGIEIKTKNTSLTANNAVFWINARDQVTEVYLLEGALTDSGGKYLAVSDFGKTFAQWTGNQKELKYTSQAWDEKPLEIRLAGIYPELVKLAEKAEKDWEKGRVTDQYAELRRKGWRKASRLAPAESKDHLKIK